MSSFEFLNCFLSAHLCFALIETISSIVTLINLWPLMPIRNTLGLRF
ncbi:hypothetical protein M5D96_007960 [Drosophila gunungcola]|uniref:Uncharacterized protein n=1 Tax=Drosophila gunungcola TaxID=103775 RepID=A0A9P9YLJ6_9MUSC|nr:hypothetical protein M5D96_007960 [Drosophila gunungcola]